jgi:hypothetical protein
MKKLKIKTHQMKNAYTENHFFILSKGLNAGKPIEKPCPNCFVMLAKSEEEKKQIVLAMLWTVAREFLPSVFNWLSYSVYKIRRP